MQKELYTMNLVRKILNPSWSVIEFYRFLQTIHFLDSNNDLSEEWVSNMDVELVMDLVPNHEMSGLNIRTGYLINEATLNYFKIRYNEQTTETKKATN